MCKSRLAKRCVHRRTTCVRYYALRHGLHSRPGLAKYGCFCALVTSLRLTPLCYTLMRRRVVQVAPYVELEKNREFLSRGPVRFEQRFIADENGVISDRAFNAERRTSALLNAAASDFEARSRQRNLPFVCVLQPTQSTCPQMGSLQSKCPNARHDLDWGAYGDKGLQICVLTAEVCC